jgi:hypothetical protein
MSVRVSSVSVLSYVGSGLGDTADQLSKESYRVYKINSSRLIMMESRLKGLIRKMEEESISTPMVH